MLLSNVRFAFRMMRSSLPTTVAAILALTLGIGATSAIFSILNAVLLKPLPYSRPDRLVFGWATNPSKKIVQQRISPPNLMDAQKINHTVHLGAFLPGSVVMSGGEAPVKLDSVAVSPDLFEMLGVAPIVGTNFPPSSGTWGQNHLVILSDGFWKAKFAGATSGVVGRKLILDGAPYEISGIMPAGFRLMDADAEVFVPYAVPPDQLGARGRGKGILTIVGRLNDGVTIDQARADFDAVALRLAEIEPDANRGYGLRLVPLAEQLTGNLRSTLYILFAAVSVVLLISCANVANLLLARAGARQKEIAIRSALGAGSASLIGQLLTESILLSLTGGVLGLVLAWISVQAFLKVGPAELTKINSFTLDPSVLGFTFLVSVLTGMLFGLAPALTFLKIDLNSVLRSAGRGNSSDGKRTLIRNALVVVEIAMSMILLTGCGLLLRSFWTLEQIDRGYQVSRVLTFKVALPEARYKELAIPQFYRKLIERLETLPGVEAAGMTRDVPLSGTNPTLNYELENSPPMSGSEQPRARYRVASADYFKVLGIRLLNGRFLERSDTETSQQVMIINKALADVAFPNIDPLGHRIRCGLEDSPWSTIVGVVDNTRAVGLDAKPEPETFYPYTQVVRPYLAFVEGTGSLVVRTALAIDPQSLTSSVRQVVRELDPELAVFHAMTMEDIFSNSIAQPRFRTLLIVAFAVTALLLAMIGVYGVLSYSVSQRTQEIGVRLALGAEPGEVVKMIVGQGMRLGIIGVVIGLAASFLLAQAVLKTLLFGVQPWDAWSFLLTPAILLTVTLLAVYLPARRALKIDPLEALRSD